MPSIDALAARLSTYLGKDQVNLVRRAYFYAEQAHDGQRRRSGEPYVTHPLAVAEYSCRHAHGPSEPDGGHAA